MSFYTVYFLIFAQNKLVKYNFNGVFVYFVGIEGINLLRKKEIWITKVFDHAQESNKNGKEEFASTSDPSSSELYYG